MDVVADFPVDAQTPEPVQQGEGLLDHPSIYAQPRTVLRASSGDDRCDPDGSYLIAALVVVVAAVGIAGRGWVGWPGSGA